MHIITLQTAVHQDGRKTPTLAWPAKRSPQLSQQLSQQPSPRQRKKNTDNEGYPAVVLIIAPNASKIIESSREKKSSEAEIYRKLMSRDRYYYPPPRFVWKLQSRKIGITTLPHHSQPTHPSLQDGSNFDLHRHRQLTTQRNHPQTPSATNKTFPIPHSFQQLSQ